MKDILYYRSCLCFLFSFFFIFNPSTSVTLGGRLIPKCIEFKQRWLTRATNVSVTQTNSLGRNGCRDYTIQTVSGVVLSVTHRNQANSRPQCSERKTRLLFLRVRARMERVLFSWNITCLYSDWISWSNSMLVHCCWVGTGIWTMAASERMRSWAACQSLWWAKAWAQMA